MKVNIIDYIIKNTALKQKDIAEKLNVSRAQVSRWKTGESIPFNRQEELNQLAGLFGDNEEWAILIGSEERSKEWIDYVVELNDYAEYGPCEELVDNPEVSVPHLFLTLSKIGIKIPDEIPCVTDSEDDTKLDDFTLLLINIIYNLTIMSRWINESFKYLDENVEFFDWKQEIISIYYDISIVNVIDQIIMMKLTSEEKCEIYRCDTLENANNIINNLCNLMMEKSMPIYQNYFDLIEKDPSSSL
jgi:transcriptional regulator with XRE-family HTH domain